MTADSVMARGRLAAEALMVDTCVIKRRISHTTNADTGQITVNYSTIYTGNCRVQERSMFDRPHTVGEAFVTMLAVEVQLPMSATGVDTDDIITILTAAQDPDLVGRVFTVRGHNHRTFTTMRRFQCLEINS